MCTQSWNLLVYVLETKKRTTEKVCLACGGVATRKKKVPAKECQQKAKSSEVDHVRYTRLSKSII